MLLEMIPANVSPDLSLSCPRFVTSYHHQLHHCHYHIGSQLVVDIAILDVSSQDRPGNKRFELSTCMKYCMRPQSSFFFEDVEAVENWVNSCPLTRLVGRNHRHDAFGSPRPWGWKMIQSSGCQLPTNQQPNNHPPSLLHIHYVTISRVLSIIHFLMVCRW